MRAPLFAICLWIGLSSSAFAQSPAQPRPPASQVPALSETEPEMGFSWFDTCETTNPPPSCGRDIMAHGTITRQTPDVLEAFLIAHPAPLDRIPSLYFDSHGGHVLGSLQLGLALRAHGMDTAVAREMNCLSACVYAFLGGRRRSIFDESLVGVHRFQSLAGPEGNLDESQRLVALISDYTLAMGASPDFMRAVALGSETKLVRLTRPLARTLGVDNTDPAPARWAINPSEKGLDLFIEQQAMGSDRRALFALGRREGQGRAVLIYREPSQYYSRTLTQAEQSERPILLVCRVSASLEFDDKRCAQSEQSSAWEADQPAPGRFRVAFGLDLATVLAAVGAGAPDDYLFITIAAPHRTREILVLRTPAEQFAPGLRSLLAAP